MLGDTHDYAAMATPVTSAQVAKAWVRPDRMFAAVSWSRQRGLGRGAGTQGMGPETKRRSPDFLTSTAGLEE